MPPTAPPCHVAKSVPGPVPPEILRSPSPVGWATRTELKTMHTGTWQPAQGPAPTVFAWSICRLNMKYSVPGTRCCRCDGDTASAILIRAELGTVGPTHCEAIVQ